MTDRQRKGIGFLATAGVFAVAGGVLLLFQVTPTWVPVLIDAAVAVLAVFGIVITAKPEV
jgi:hypothetical protein